MMKTLILICALGLPRPDCSTETAISVIQGPDAANLARCGFLGQAYLANTVFADYLNGDHYLKITCTAGDRLDAQTAPPVPIQEVAQPVQQGKIDEILLLSAPPSDVGITR